MKSPTPAHGTAKWPTLDILYDYAALRAQLDRDALADQHWPERLLALQGAAAARAGEPRAAAGGRLGRPFTTRRASRRASAWSAFGSKTMAPTPPVP